MKKIKPISIIITVVAVAALVFLLMQAKHHMSAPATTAPVANTPASQSICYYLNKPSVGAPELGNDLAYVKLTVGDGNAVTGTMGTQIAGKDTEVGTLSGSLTAGTSAGQFIFNGTYTTNSEGMHSATAQRIVLNPTAAEIDYGSSSLSVPHVDCSQYPGLV
ncbi:MAG TPA: hypothetical protein VL576_00330 [Candidatus Paceibacterota bacterium]|jgi:hypothetical protein|nr:hypothetical protein [Candidatus Paceibacterota bacterium]